MEKADSGGHGFGRGHGLRVQGTGRHDVAVQPLSKGVIQDTFQDGVVCLSMQMIIIHLIVSYKCVGLYLGQNKKQTGVVWPAYRSSSFYKYSI